MSFGALGHHKCKKKKAKLHPRIFTVEAEIVYVLNSAAPIFQIYLQPPEMSSHLVFGAAQTETKTYNICSHNIHRSSHAHPPKTPKTSPSTLHIQQPWQHGTIQNHNNAVQYCMDVTPQPYMHAYTIVTFHFTAQTIKVVEGNPDKELQTFLWS